MQIPKERENAKAKKEVMAVQTSHLGASKLWRSFLEGVAQNFALKIDKLIMDNDESIIKPKKRKRKKGIDRNAIVYFAPIKDHKPSD